MILFPNFTLSERSEVWDKSSLQESLTDSTPWTSSATDKTNQRISNENTIRQEQHHSLC